MGKSKKFSNEFNEEKFYKTKQVDCDDVSDHLFCDHYGSF